MTETEVLGKYTLKNRKYAPRRNILYARIWIDRTYYQDILSLRKKNESVSDVINFLYSFYITNKPVIQSITKLEERGV
jgi:predicted CopG family antitoxin